MSDTIEFTAALWHGNAFIVTADGEARLVLAVAASELQQVGQAIAERRLHDRAFRVKIVLEGR